MYAKPKGAANRRGLNFLYFCSFYWSFMGFWTVIWVAKVLCAAMLWRKIFVRCK